ncbi:hypothetical protein FC093_01820 [Ilyomonas limi]|uniref:Uncharacterized protein n=1 Tax=Ilyomonas limi TaxID=2575867 RepID=A0A4U3L8Y3_9BACT|nr:hypothetical protein [Ilyomonas limi]TKK71781.1 hypothetical protein FC093_01820 [Ilyomonas limi]
MSCNNNKKTNAEPAADSTVYYPINNYIRQQIKQVDTTPYYVYRVLVMDGKKDSTTISRPVFDSLTKQFLLPELEEDALKKNFTESVYGDQSTNSITLTYTPKDSNTTVQNAMVLLDPNSQDIKWIFINTLQNKGDSTVIQKIGWKGGTSCYLNRSASYADGKKNEMQLNIVWNEK